MISILNLFRKKKHEVKVVIKEEQPDYQVILYTNGLNEDLYVPEFLCNTILGDKYFPMYENNEIAKKAASDYANALWLDLEHRGEPFLCFSTAGDAGEFLQKYNRIRQREAWKRKGSVIKETKEDLNNNDL